MTDHRQHYEDRLVDLALSERVGGEKPTDLSGKILAAGQEPVQPGGHTERIRTSTPARLTCAVSVGLLAAALAFAIWSPPPDPSSLTGAYTREDVPRLEERFKQLMQQRRYRDAVTVARQVERLSRDDADAARAIAQRMELNARIALEWTGKDELHRSETFSVDGQDDYRRHATLAFGGGQDGANFDALIDMIQSTTAPETWNDVGGPGSIESYSGNLSLIVDQSQSISPEQIADYNMGLGGAIRDAYSNDSRHIVLQPLYAGFPAVRDGDGAVRGHSLLQDMDQRIEPSGAMEVHPYNAPTSAAPVADPFGAAPGEGQGQGQLPFFANRADLTEGDGEANEALLRQQRERGEAVAKGIKLAQSQLGDELVAFDVAAAIDGKKTDEIPEAIVAAAKARVAHLKRVKELRETWRKAAATPNATRLMIGDDDALPLEGVQANVVVDGFRARVLLDLFFFNDHERQLEGNFQLRLPDEASLYYFAFGETAYEYKPADNAFASRELLDFEVVRASGTEPRDIFESRKAAWSSEHVKEARMVPREKAAYAYSEMTRRRVDPALVEWAGAGMFNAKVFPLAAGKLHRIVVGYDVNLRHDDDGLSFRFDVPPAPRQRVVDFNVTSPKGVDVSFEPKAETALDGNQRRSVRFTKFADDHVTVKLASTEPILLTGRDKSSKAESDEHYFATEVTPDLPVEETAGAPHAVFLLDTSLSSHAERFNLWLETLREVLNKNRPQLSHFAVLAFDVETRWWQPRFVENTPENVEAVLRYAESLSLEGATDLGRALREAAAPAWSDDPPAKCDLFLLSDGGPTWGETNLRRMVRSLAGRTVFAYRTKFDGTATGVLEFLARESGGAVFSLDGSEAVAEAAVAHRRRPWKLLDVSLAGGRDVLVAGRPQTIFPGQRLTIVGRGEPQQGAMLKLRVKRDDELNDIEVTLKQTVASTLAPRLYGSVAVGQLENALPDGDATAVAFARHFRITGRSCSLLMLETEEDYQRFEIKPEDDAALVAGHPASEAVANADDALAGRLADPRQMLLARLERLASIPNVGFTLSPELRTYIESLPEQAFDVDVAPLRCELQQRSDLPKEIAAELAARAADRTMPGYDLLHAESVRRLKEYGADDALKALSSLVENNPGDPTLLRDVAYSATAWKQYGQAYQLLERATDIRPYEPHGYLAMARCLQAAGARDLAAAYYEIALGGEWDGRFGAFRQIAAIEYTRFLRGQPRETAASATDAFLSQRLKPLTQQFDLSARDLVVTMMWNTDRTDVDLHVIEPSGEECSYEHTTTRSGGAITQDVTQGLGPEMYTLTKAPAGKYRLTAHYYSSDQSRTLLRTRVQVTIYQHFGRPDERVTTKAISLKDQSESVDIGTVGF